MACILSSNGNACVLLTLKISAGFVISDAIEYNLILSTFYKIYIQVSSPEP